MSRTIFNELGENRVINPRSGSSQFVDLSSNQTIAGVKTFIDNIYLNSNLISTGDISTTGTISGTFINNNQFVDLSSNQSISGVKQFLNNLITNSDVNFNTTANVGRIIFNPNEPGGSGSQIVSIYTTDEIDGQGWIFDSVGNLYYIGGGLSPVKIMLSGATGDVTILSNFNGFGDIICYNNLTSDIINSYSGGNITFNNGIVLGSNIINSGNITSNGTITGVDISSTGIIFANNVNLTSTGYLNVNNITSSVVSGSYQTKIALSNEFIDINNSSLDIVATYIGFASPAQTLATTSKYMFIKPLSTGNFEMLMNNIANKILISDWATTKISSQFIWNLNNISNQNVIILDSLTTSSNRLQLYGIAAGTKYLYYNISNELGVIDGSTSQWKITGVGDATLSLLNCGTIISSGNISGSLITGTSLNAGSGLISTTGNISGASITGTTSLITNLINASTGTIKNLIQMDNKFIDTATGSVDIKSTYVGFPQLSQTLTTASKYMYIKPLTTGDFEIKINNISNVVLATDWSQLATTTQFTSSWYNTAGVLMGFINPNPPTASSPTMRIMGTSNQYIYYNTLNNFGNYNSTTSTTNWEISSVGAITCSALNASSGTIQTTGSVLTNTINPVSGTTISSTSIWNFKNGANIPILLDPTTTSGNRLQIYGVVGGTRYLFFNTSNTIGVFNTATGANVWSIDGTTGNINTIGILTYATLSATSLLTNSISPISPSTTIDFGITSNCNWLKSAGINRIKFYPSSTTGDIMQISRVGDTSLTSGYLYFNNSGNMGYNTSSVSNWELLSSGVFNALVVSATQYQAKNTYTYKNAIDMENLYYNPSIASIDLRAQYIGFAHPNNALSISSKYGAIVTFVGGDVGFSINNISGYAWATSWVDRLLYTDYTFQCQKSSFVVNYRYQKFMNGATEIGSITMNTASSIAFNNSSDYRLKQDIIPIENPLERLMKLKPKNYRFIADAQDESCCHCYFDGFLAHEVQDIIPMAVCGVKDDPDNFQQLDYSKFTPLLTGAVQELNEKVEKQQILIDKQQILIDSLMKRLEILENK
jgi:hypothetical protein